MQADGGFIEHVAHAAQVRAQLRGEAQALRLAAGQRRRGAIQRQIGQAHALQETEAAVDLLHDVRGDGRLARVRASACRGIHASSVTARPASSRDGLVAELHRQRQRIRAARHGSLAQGAGLRPLPCQQSSSPLCSASNSLDASGRCRSSSRTSRASCCRRTAADPVRRSPCRSWGRRAVKRRTAWRRRLAAAASAHPCRGPGPCAISSRSRGSFCAADLHAAQRQLDVMRLVARQLRPLRGGHAACRPRAARRSPSCAPSAASSL